MHIATSRRGFLKSAASSAALVALAPAVPQFLLNASAQAAEARGDSVLVVIQLSGGNDGLNTVIPYPDDVYRKNRRALGIPAAKVLKIDDYVGLHPSMEGFAKMLESHRLGIVQGVGYPNPNRSHFSSMDIWHTARPRQADAARAADATGWIGRYLDSQSTVSGDVPALQLTVSGARLPLALIGRHPRASSMRSLDSFKLEDGGDASLRAAIEQAARAPRDGNNDLVGFLRDGTLSALQSSKHIQESAGTYHSDVPYPETGLGRRLKTVAQLIDAGLSTRVYYLDLDGFDTHSSQAAAHAGLLAELSGAVSAFIDDLARHGHDRRVLLMTFSEFGRRVHENASLGTDHGAAAPMFIAGGRVRPGLLTKHSSMTDLDAGGDIQFTTDFRSVYAGVLEHWLAVPPAPILGGTFPAMRLTT